MPNDPGGKETDPTLVNVTYQAPGSDAEVSLKQVPDESACGSLGGWFYDDPLGPSAIHLCPSTCNSVQEHEGAKIGIVLGCKTQIQ
jgi:hypothetical protein